MKFQNKRVVITGGAAGIGKAIVAGFIREGAIVHALDFDREMLHRLRTEKRFTGGLLSCHPCNVANEQDVIRVVGKIIIEGAIDVLINNAGINHSPSPVTETSAVDWQRILTNNLSPMHLVSKAIIPNMPQGTIINIASILGLTGGRSCSAYSASKGGVIALTKSMALDHAPNIRVNCICPGAISTQMFEEYVKRCDDPAAEIKRIVEAIPLKRLGTVQDITKAILFLASDDAAWITGVSLVVDGGDTL